MTKTEEDKFIEFVNRYSVEIRKLSNIFGSGRAVYANDIQQEIVLHLFEEYKRYGFSRCHDANAERNWVRQVALHVAINYEARFRSKLPVSSLTEVELEIALSDDELQAKEYLEEVLDCLEAKDKRMLLYLLNQYSYEQIADREQISESAVGTRMSRIFEKLRSKLKR